MTKRKLTQKQVRTQANIRANRLSRAAKTESTASDLGTSSDMGALGPEVCGLLVAHHGAHMIVEDNLGALHQCLCRNNLGLLATGDRVIWQSFPDGKGVIVAFEPRTSAIARPTRRHEMRPMAANVTCIAIVVAPFPEPSATTLDRYLVISEHLGIPCLIVVNKIDLLDSNQATPFHHLMDIYRDIGYPCFNLSTKTGAGLKEFELALQHRTTIFIGQSGVGKSSLISHLIPDEEIRVGELSLNTLLGKHTTTGSRLYHLPSGGQLIDSPGIRRFGVDHLSKEVILSGFKEFGPYIGKCQFRNCNHLHEPGCAIKEGIEAGKIHAKRLQNYHELITQPDY